MHILIVTTEWPTEEHPDWAPFIVQQVEYLRRANVVVTVYALRGGKQPKQYLRAWRELRSQYDLSQFDMIHGHFGQSGLVTLPAPVPVITTFHGSDLQGYRDSNGREYFSSRILRQISRHVARRSDGVILVADRLSRYLPQRVAHEVIPCGLNLNLFAPSPMAAARRTLNLPPHKRYVLFAANPERPVKRFPLAQQAVAQLRGQWDIELLVVSGEPHDRMPLFMNAADLLLLTSRHEGSPTVIKEALACNLPIVSADVGDVRQRIEHIDGNVIVTPDTPAHFATAIAQTLERNQRTDGRRAVAELDEALIIAKLIAFYGRLCRHD